VPGKSENEPVYRDLGQREDGVIFDRSPGLGHRTSNTAGPETKMLGTSASKRTNFAREIIEAAPRPHYRRCGRAIVHARRRAGMAQTTHGSLE
jgi:hypothetical protein